MGGSCDRERDHVIYQFLLSLILLTREDLTQEQKAFSFEVSII